MRSANSTKCSGSLARVLSLCLWRRWSASHARCAVKDEDVLGWDRVAPAAVGLDVVLDSAHEGLARAPAFESSYWSTWTSGPLPERKTAAALGLAPPRGMARSSRKCAWTRRRPTSVLPAPGDAGQEHEATRPGPGGFVDDRCDGVDGRLGVRMRAMHSRQIAPQEELPSGLHQGWQRLVGTACQKAGRSDGRDRVRLIQACEQAVERVRTDDMDAALFADVALGACGTTTACTAAVWQSRW